MSRAVLLGSLIYVLFLAGAVTLHGELLALAVPLVVYLAAALIFGPGEPKLALTRTLSAHRVSSSEPVTVKLVITNQGSGLEELLAVDTVARSLEVSEGAPRAAAALQPGGTLELVYTVRGKRGCYDFGDVRFQASDHLGLFRWRKTLTVPDQLTVLPQLLKLRPLAIRPLRTLAHSGTIPSRQGGSGVDFFGVRDYQLGDPLRWINWPKTARHPSDLFTNQFEQERIADVGLILDARLRSNLKSSGESLFEYAVTAAASLGQVFLSSGNRVGLLIYGLGLDWTFPGYGKRQLERILQSLARAAPGDSDIFESLEYMPARLFPARSQIVFVSPLWNDDLSILIRLRGWGYQILAVCPDPVAFEARNLATHPDSKLAARVARLERTLFLRRLRQAGVWIANWHVDDPLDQAILASVGHTPGWFRNVSVGPSP